MEYSQLDDIDLFKKLEKAELHKMLETSPEWGMLKEASERIVENAIREFVLNTDADNLVKIINLQMTIRKYKFELFAEIDQIAQDGELAFNEAKYRGVL